jgi:hypothetical protein
MIILVAFGFCVLFFYLLLLLFFYLRAPSKYGFNLEFFTFHTDHISEIPDNKSKISFSLGFLRVRLGLRFQKVRF